MDKLSKTAHGYWLPPDPAYHDKCLHQLNLYYNHLGGAYANCGEDYDTWNQIGIPWCEWNLMNEKERAEAILNFYSKKA